MYKIIKLLFLIIFLATFSIGANSETSWITKKDKSSKKIVKKTKSETNQWIKKKEVKENKKKLKEKIKDSKSWITKKSKNKIKDIKNKLKKYKKIEHLPKAEAYFVARIEPSNDKEATYFYGYINSENKSNKFKFNNKNYYRNNDGIVFFEDKEKTCEVDTLKGVLFDELQGKIIITCNKKKIIGANIVFKNDGTYGDGTGEYTDGSKVEFEFYSSKNKVIAALDNFKEQPIQIARTLPSPKNNEDIELKPTGKYYALLIGNSNYTKWASLTSPKNDINEIGKILKNNYNFEKVIILPDANRKDIFKKLKELSNITSDRDYVLIYYSGHGDEDGTQRYWIPIDGEKESGYGDWININDIQRYIEKIPNTHIVMMSDSCYFAMETKGNQIQKHQRSQSYQKLLNRRAVIVVGSGSNEPVSDTSQNKHSMFGMSFIQSLKNNSSAIRMKDIVENIILAHSGMQQQPYGIGIGAWGHSGGDFIFIRKK